MLVDDNPELRSLVTAVLERAGYEIAAAVDSYDSAVAVEREVVVAVVDIRLGGKSGIDLTRELSARGVRVLIYTGARDRESLRAALQAGAAGLVWKGDPIGELAEAVAKVAGGEGYIAPRLRARLASPPRARLSPREREVLFLLATGLTNEELAAQLGLSPETTRTQIRSAMRKLGARTRPHAVAIAASQGEITPL
jgi:DNA-binding NarL/FixJ family response regulator